MITNLLNIEPGKKIDFEGERERKSVGSLGMLGFGVCFGGTSRDYVI